MEIDNFFIKHKDPPVFRYVLIDWSRPAPHSLLKQKAIDMDVYEAWDLNKNFNLNNITKRYVREDLYNKK